MKRDAQQIAIERQAQIDTIRRAATDAVREALRRHMLLGESVAVADDSGNGAVKVLGPEDIRKALRAA